VWGGRGEWYSSRIAGRERGREGPDAVGVWLGSSLLEMASIPEGSDNCSSYKSDREYPAEFVLYFQCRVYETTIAA